MSELSSPTAPVPPASPLAPAAVDALRRGVVGAVTYPADPAYPDLVARRPSSTPRPAVVVEPRSEADVVAALCVARPHDLAVLQDALPAGVGATSRPGMLVLTHHLATVEIVREQAGAVVGPGATWHAVTAAAARHGLEPAPGLPAEGSVLSSLDRLGDGLVAARVIGLDGFARSVGPADLDSVDGVVTSVVVRLEPVVAALRYAAFTADPSGGNPAGLVLDAEGLSDEQMQRIAAEIGYSETAFVTGAPYVETLRVRYFSPLAEVDFCGHATIATAVAIGERHGPGTLVLETNAGTVPVAVEVRDGRVQAELTSVETSSVPATDAQVDATLAALGWTRDDLGDLPPHVAYGGNHHLVLHVADRARLAALDYDFDALAGLMTDAGWTTIDLIHPDGDVVHCRNPFPVGGVVEDPATGAAAAALGGYLLAIGEVREPRRIVVHQGDDMGRPSRIGLSVEPGDLRVRVAGTAVRLPG